MQPEPAGESGVSSRPPLDLEAVAVAARPFGRSRMLPVAAYLDPAVLAWERQVLFGGWMCVARGEDVPTAGAHAVSGGDAGVLLVRDCEGELRAFHNACRHRGHELLGCGDRTSPKAIVCPYHAWTYDLTGRLVGAPGLQHAPDFDRSQFGLRRVRLQEWHGWVFIDTSGVAPPFADHVGNLEAVVAPYRPEELVTAARHDYVVESNWKVLVENYQECSHCSMIHPELCRVSPPDSGNNLDPRGGWVGGRLDLRDGAETMSLTGRSDGMAIPGLGPAEQRTVMYAVVMPNLLVSLHPDYVMTHLLVPLDAGRTAVTCSWAFPAGAVERPGFDPAYAVDFWDLTNTQDWSACESVQRGLRTPGFVPGPLAPAEDGVYQFVRWMAETYLTGRFVLLDGSVVDVDAIRAAARTPR